MNHQDYRNRVYSRYVSAFKEKQCRVADYTFSDSKLIPVLRPWLSSLDRGAPCIDLGCGHGNVLHALQTLGFTEICGVDVSAEQVGLARKICLNVEVGEIYPYLEKFSDNHLGLITLFDVIEHLTKDEILSLLDLIYRKLRSGGIFIAHSPNGDSPMVQQVFSADFTHETLLNTASAELICKLAGFSNFTSTEHLGTSSALHGQLRKFLWSIQRTGFRTMSLIETGNAGSDILTRNFAFKAIRL